MKAGKRPRVATKQKGLGLVANGSAGSWRVDVDETLSGAQKWFAQIEGPSCYLYFEIGHPNVMVRMGDFLRHHSQQGDASLDSISELKLGNCGGHAVELLWDREPADRCFLLLRGDHEFCVRVTLLHDDLHALVNALEQVREGLAEDGLLAKSP